MKRKTLKIIAGIAALMILLGLCWFANALVGNPVSKMLASRSAQRHLEETYPDTVFYVDRVSYSFKEVGYYAQIKAPGSEDSSFSLYFDMAGHLQYDSYEHRVAGGVNTAERLNKAYRELVDTVLDSLAFPYQCDIAFGDLEFCEGGEDQRPGAIDMSGLELDKMYDLSELGAQAGHLTIYIVDETVSDQRMDEVVKEIRDCFDEAGVSFSTIEAVLHRPSEKDGEGWDDDQIEVRSLSYQDIGE